VRFRIASYNIRHGGRSREAPLGEVLRSLDADLTILQEATDPVVVRSLAAATGSAVILAAPGRSVAVLGRLDGVCARWHRPTAHRSFAEVIIPGAGLRVLGVHLTAGMSRRGERRRLRELASLLAIADAAPHSERTVIAGDLNAVSPGDTPRVAAMPAWIRMLLRFDGGIRTAVVEGVQAAGFVDAHRLVHPADAGETMPATAPVVRLDHLFVRRGLVSGVAACSTGASDRALAATASDHLPITMDLDTGPSD
jgi:endonuclease/exonuclease/phosphatase family metal-dependent hydrolase